MKQKSAWFFCYSPVFSTTLTRLNSNGGSIFGQSFETRNESQG
jgi:hypothetical protein